MSDFSLRQGQRYRATLSLGLFEQFATNEMIAERLRAAGFADVRVDGEGKIRRAEGVWQQSDMIAELPQQVKSVTEV